MVTDLVRTVERSSAIVRLKSQALRRESPVTTSCGQSCGTETGVVASRSAPSCADEHAAYEMHNNGLGPIQVKDTGHESSTFLMNRTIELPYTKRNETHAQCNLIQTTNVSVETNNYKHNRCTRARTHARLRQYGFITV